MFYEKKKKEKFMHCPGIEPGSKAWKALMITTTLAVLYIKDDLRSFIIIWNDFFNEELVGKFAIRYYDGNFLIEY